MFAAPVMLMLNPVLPAGPMLGRIDNFWILLALVIGSAIWEWLKKKGQTEQTGSGHREPESPRSTSAPHRPATAPSAASPHPATSEWEKELRRLLGGEPPVAKPPPIAQPPVRPVILHEPEPFRSPPPVVTAAPVARTVPPRLAESRIAEAERSVVVQLPALEESTTAYQRASRLHEGVAERLKRVEEITEHHLGKVPALLHPNLSAETAQTISLVRHPRTARQAMIASLIFGPPRALEGE